MKQADFPIGWNPERVHNLLQHYETQTENDAVAEDEAVFNRPDQTVMKIPNALVHTVRELIAKYALQTVR